MKILLICKSLPHRYQGGIQTHTWQLAAHLTERGHEVKILTAGSWHNGEKHYTMEGRHIIELPYLPLRYSPVCSHFLEELSFNMSVKNWLSNHYHQFDLVHLQGRSGFLTPQLGLPIPIVATFHGLVNLENKFSKTALQIGQKIHQIWASHFEKKCLQNADACIAVSREMLSEMTEVSPKIAEKTTVLPNGVNSQTVQKAEKNSETLVFIGRLEAIKGVNRLLDVLPFLDKNIHLTLIGDGSERKNIENRLFTEGYQNRVSLLGGLPNQAVLAQIQQSFALVLPSSHETQGIVLLEANACGKPVVASRVGGIVEVVEEHRNGLLFDLDNLHELAAKINFLYKNPDLAQKMGENGRKIVSEKYSWSKIAADTEGIYQRILEHKKREQKPAHIGVDFATAHIQTV
ncbi:MAG: glycosyltransferase family 4 protein [Saprospiraceae bacterium]|nr:glycosyltransferase family 4 protein [Saprospiraceae bacterium]